MFPGLNFLPVVLKLDSSFPGFPGIILLPEANLVMAGVISRATRSCKQVVQVRPSSWALFQPSIKHSCLDNDNNQIADMYFCIRKKKKKKSPRSN